MHLRSDHRFLLSGLFSMHTSGFVLGYYNSWEMHSFPGLRVLCGRNQYSRGFNHNVPSCHGTEGFKAGFEKEVCVRVHVRARIVVSPDLARSYNCFTDLNLQCMHHEYDTTQIHHFVWNVDRLDL